MKYALKGVAGIPQFVSVPKNPGKSQSSKSETKGPFGQLFNNKIKNLTDKGTKSESKEIKLLKKALKKLEELKGKLAVDGDAKGKVDLKGKDLKELIEEMSKDKEFIQMLPLDMQALLQKLEQGNFTGVSKEDLQKLTDAWQQRNDSLVKEIDQLMTAVKERLELVEGNSSKKKLTGQNWNQLASSDKNFDPVSQKELDQFSLKDLKKAINNKPINNKGTKALLSRISDLFGKANTEGFAQFEKELKQLLARHQKTISADANYMQFKLDSQEKVITATEGKEKSQSDTGQEQAGTQSHIDLALNNEITQAESKETSGEFQLKGERFNMPEPEQLLRQVVEKFNLDIKDGISEMEIQLHPEELGKMQLKLVMEDGTVTAKFLTENSKVKELIEQNLSLLRDNLAEENIQWDEITVDVGQDELAENPFAEQQQFEDDNGNSEAHFSLNPDEIVTGEEIEVEEDENSKDPDKLVDYMA